MEYFINNKGYYLRLASFKMRYKPKTNNPSLQKGGEQSTIYCYLELF
jgi:hypothetical protein